CYATARYVWPAQPGFAAGAAALVAFNPQWLFHHALVSNDPPLIMLSSWLIFLAVVAAQPGVRSTAPRGTWQRDWRLPLLCGVLVGLMLLTKQSAFALVPVP